MMRSAIVRILPVSLLVLAACASPEAPGRNPDPNALLLRIHTAGGFVPEGADFRSVPEFTLSGDGRVFTVGPQIQIYPGPALANILFRTISEAGVDKILAAARDAGLEGENRTLRSPGVADAPTTTFTIVAERTTVIAVEALGIDSAGEIPAEERELRKKLQKFRDDVSNLAEWLGPANVGEEQPYAFTELRILVGPEVTPPDPSFKTQTKEWPLPARPLATFGEDTGHGRRCGTVKGDDLETLRPHVQSSNELTTWTSAGGRFHLTLRPLLPDETGC